MNMLVRDSLDCVLSQNQIVVHIINSAPNLLRGFSMRPPKYENQWNKMSDGSTDKGTSMR